MHGLLVCVFVFIFAPTDFRLQGVLLEKTWALYFARNGKATQPKQLRWQSPDPTLSPVPSADAYYALDFTIWVPDISFSYCVPFMPCGVTPECKAECKPASHARTARKVQGMERPELLLQARYICPKCKSSFTAASDIAMAKLPDHVREAFPYVLTEAHGVTKQ